jgi:type III pantothenate kinase
MWLTLDIGNSALKAGLFDGAMLVRTLRVPVADGQLDVGGEAALRAALRDGTLTRAGLSSVIPVLTATVTTFLKHEAGLTVERVTPAMRLPFRLAYATPHTLGADRLAAAAGAWTMFDHPHAPAARPVVAIDAGTALTYEVVDHAGVYHGGAIAPGPQLLQRALNQGTAQLPEVPLVLPAQPLGRSTREALQAGLLYGLIDGVRGMLARLEALLERPPHVVATGGWAPLLHAHVPGIERVEPHLVLHGIRVLMELNPPAG